MLAAGAAAFSYWTAAQWGASWYLAAATFALACLGALALTLLPRIEVHESHLQIGRRTICWTEVRRLDRTNWTTPLVVHLTLADSRTVTLIHPGDSVSSTSLLRHLCRYARVALLDGVPYNQFWGDHPVPHKQIPPPRPLLRAEDEEEVERLFQRLKAGGRLDQKDEKVDQRGPGER